jgi:TonB family protein
MPPTTAAALAGSAPTTRLLLFVAASIALHGITLGFDVPSDGARRRAPSASATPPLDATLMRASDAAASAPVTATSEQTSEHGGNAQTDTQDATGPARGPAAADRLNLRFPDKWYSASELDVRAEPLDAVEFEYPRSPGGGVIIGRVELALYVDERGYVRKLEVRKSEPERVFDEAALKGWRDVRFSPAMRGGTAVKSEKIVQVDFQP